MRKRKTSLESGRDYWIWEMPELVDELPKLLSAAGEVKILRRPSKYWNYADVEITLSQPAKVRDWFLAAGDGMAINSDTGACIGTMLDASVHKLPKTGDRSIRLSICLELHTFQVNEKVTLEQMHGYLRNFAEAMTKTWYYHFK